jgi:hypothetical protein
MRFTGTTRPSHQILALNQLLRALMVPMKQMTTMKKTDGRTKNNCTSTLFLKVMHYRPSLQSPLLNSKDNMQNIVQTILQDRCNIPAQGLTGLIGYSYQQVTTSFQEAHLQRTPKLSVLGLERWVTNRKVLPGCARVRTKCTEKTCVGL